jgi:biopolymer transport protein ExbD
MDEDAGLKLNLTSLIDVTFLILIFLMVLPFRTLERKLSANLPQNVGMDNRVAPDPGPKLTVVLRPEAGSGETRVRLLDTQLGIGDVGFRLLDRRLGEIHASDPKIPGEIDAAGEVPHQDVIRTVDSFKRAGVTEIVFRGAKMPSGSLATAR